MDQGSKSDGVKETKKFEVETSKGILSITTTIEDSKINDIVFEKTKNAKKSKAATIKAAAKSSTTNQNVSKAAKGSSKDPSAKLDPGISDSIKEEPKTQSASKTIVIDMAATPKVANVVSATAIPLPEVKPKPVSIKMLSKY